MYLFLRKIFPISLTMTNVPEGNYAKTIVFLKRNWLMIVAVMTILSLIHLVWYVSQVKSLEQIFDTKALFSHYKNDKTPYNFGLQIGYYTARIFKTPSILIGIVGLTILLAEFNYKTIFKNLFIEEGKGGKLLFVLVFFFEYLFFRLTLNIILGKKIEPLGIHIFLANFWIVWLFIHSSFSYATESYERMKEMAYQKTKAELVALKAQINPHFLFNVLNNLYGQAIVEDSPKTAEGIERLSRIMRHVVEETKTERSPIDKEIKFIEDFIALQKMRIPDRPNININTKIDWDGEPYKIAPLLIIPYLENAFKYGISINNESFIDMNLTIKDQRLNFDCKNSIIKKAHKLEVGTGTGLENTKKRLDLYYPHKYSLDVNTENDIFEVNLKLKL